ncbi:hypothetical protein [Hydrogenophaga sp.]
MTERPILFQGAMVRAVLAGTKTQTRRVVKPVGNDDGFILQDMGDGWWPYRSADGESCFYIDKAGHNMESQIPCPYGQPGDRLWVRETWAQNWNQLSDTRMDRSYVYRADGEQRAQDNGTDLPWRPSIHMPRVASRISLEITGVRVERLQDISETDAIAEGIESDVQPGDPAPLWRNYSTGNTTISPVYSYETLWESINGPGSWDTNPWVWVIEFRRCS